MKEYLQDKISRVEKYSLKECDIHVTLDVQKYRYIAEVNVNTPFANIHCKEEEADMFSAIDGVIDKVERQMRRTKEKVQHHKKSADAIQGASVAESQAILAEDFQLNTLSLLGAIEQLEEAHEHFLVFKNDESKKVDFIHKIREQGYELFELSDRASSAKDHVTLLSRRVNISKANSSGVQTEITDREDLKVDILSIPHASKKLQSLGLEFLVFFDRASGKVGVVFYREDGEIGLIEPQF